MVRNPDGSVTLRKGLPFQEKTVRITVKWPPAGLANPRTKTYVKSGNFMEILQEAQREHRGASISITPVKVF